MEKLFFPRLQKLLDYDFNRASLLFEGWRYWLQNADTKDEQTLESLETYLLYREINVAFLCVILPKYSRGPQLMGLVHIPTSPFSV